MKYRFSDFEIDLSQQELRREGASIHIEPQVFDLIVHLVRNHDRVVSKDELIDTIWNGRVISEAAFSSRINGARRALGDNGTDQLFIRTLHRRGFRFVGNVRAVEASDAAAVRLVPDAATAASDVPARVSISTDVSHLDDIVSEAVKAEAITRSSIAVLPFGNMSNDPENDYFSYGLTEDIIRLLARNRWLSVISRHSTIGFQGRVVDAREVGAQLGVIYVMSGSVRKSRDTVRITAELARAADGKQLWSDKYELQLENIFDIQEELARQIAATIEPELSKVEQQLAARKAPESLDAWDCYQRGLWNLWRFTTPGFDSAEIYFQRAIAADPDFARGHGALSYVNIQRSLYDDPKDRRARLETALRQARVAVALDDLDCFCHCALGRALCLTRQNDEALAAIDLSLELNPSFAQGYLPRDLICCGTGGRSKRKRCSIERLCSVRAIAISGVSITCAPGRISRLLSTTSPSSSPEGQPGNPMSRIGHLRHWRLRSAVSVRRRRPKPWPLSCCNASRTTEQIPRDRSFSSAMIKASLIGSPKGCV
jgi:TolB-like protein/DNA-binding winged helix-turn-helix (wHTH) protein